MDADARRVLEMMLQEKSIGSKKLISMSELMAVDGRLRGTLMYYGAPATGRWSGRGTQPQNYARPPKLYTTSTEALYEIIMRRDVPALAAVVVAENEARIAKKLVERLLFVDLLAAMLRGCLCARDGYIFVMADYNAIEARGGAWIAGDEPALTVFRAADRGAGPDPYCVMAGKIYNRLIVPKDEEERRLGKTVELGATYRLGWRRLGEYAKLQGVDMVKMGLDPLYVSEQYRDAHPAIAGRKVKDAVYSTVPDECRPAVRKGGVWRGLEDACRAAINGRAAESHGVRYEKVGDHVYCTLHSGRRLLYRNMHIAEMPDQFGRLRPQIVYDKPRVKRHEEDDEGAEDGAMDSVRATTHGGKCLENVCQADCRDLLASSLVDEDYIREHTVLHVHDEIILEVPEAEADAALKHLVVGMTRPKHWSAGFPLKSEAYKSKVYGKGKAVISAVDGELR